MNIQKQGFRRTVAKVSVLNINYIHLRNPWVIAWWSAAFPGCGHMSLGLYVKGFILMVWEFVINLNAKLNTAMVLSFTGQFDQAVKVLDLRWLLLYIAVYVHSIGDSYRFTVDMNHHYILARKENAPIALMKISSFGINFLNKRHPWVSLLWSALMPGMGHLYLHRILSGFILLLAWIICCYQSRFLVSMHYSFIGDFPAALAVLEKQWLLFMPSIYGFALYESYVVAVEYNNLYKKEQIQYLQAEYQSTRFRFPI